MNELVVLRDAAPMALCSICPEPGHCCRGFDLRDADGQITYCKDSWQEDYKRDFAKAGYPFIAKGIRQVSTVGDEASPDFGKRYVSLWYTCPKVTTDGRCSIYENRPGLCRIYVPGSSSLCVFHTENHHRRHA